MGVKYWPQFVEARTMISSDDVADAVVNLIVVASHTTTTMINTDPKIDNEMTDSILLDLPNSFMSEYPWENIETGIQIGYCNRPNIITVNPLIGHNHKKLY